MKRVVRKATRDDIPFIFSTWLRSYRYDSPVTWPIRHDTFFVEHQTMLEGLLIRPNVEVTISCDQADPNHIFGWLCVEHQEPLIIHYIYVKKPLRKDGVAKELLTHARIPLRLTNCVFSHYTNALGRLWKIDKILGEYNPYVLGGSYGGRIKGVRSEVREPLRDIRGNRVEI